jgi:hypothetical protein
VSVSAIAPVGAWLIRKRPGPGPGPAGRPAANVLAAGGSCRLHLQDATNVHSMDMWDFFYSASACGS